MRRDLAYLHDMLQAAYKIRRFVEGVDYEVFLDNEEKHLAIERLIEIIGEAAKRLLHAYPDYRTDYPEIPWKKITGARDVYIHRYDEVDLEDVWDTATVHVPALIAQLEPLIPPEE